MTTEQVQFVGYGGSGVEYETKVYTYRGMEIRIPCKPDTFPPDEVTHEYPWTFSGYSLEDAISEVDDLLDE